MEREGEKMSHAKMFRAMMSQATNFFRRAGEKEREKGGKEKEIEVKRGEVKRKSCGA